MLERKLNEARDANRVLAAERDEFRNVAAASQASERLAISVRENVITASVSKAERRAEAAEAERDEATTRLEAENAALRSKVKRLETTTYAISHALRSHG